MPHYSICPHDSSPHKRSAFNSLRQIFHHASQSISLFTIHFSTDELPLPKFRNISVFVPAFVMKALNARKLDHGNRHALFTTDKPTTLSELWGQAGARGYGLIYVRPYCGSLTIKNNRQDFEQGKCRKKKGSAKGFGGTPQTFYVLIMVRSNVK